MLELCPDGGWIVVSRVAEPRDDTLLEAADFVDEDDVCWIGSGERLADDLLRLTQAVHGCGVQHRDAELPGPPDHRDCFAVRDPAIGGQMVGAQSKSAGGKLHPAERPGGGGESHEGRTPFTGLVAGEARADPPSRRMTCPVRYLA